MNNISITAMYMAIGAERGLTKRESNLPEGHIGFMSDLSRYAEMSETLLEGRDEFPGVYDYEVSEPFGEWYATNDPSDSGARQKLQEMINDFFNQE